MPMSPPNSARPIVAIDGPAGAGKSTVARRVAAELNFTYIDTGAMYRAVALAAQQAGIPWDDEAALVPLVRSLRFRFIEPRPGESGLEVNDEDVSERIRTPEISRGASQVAPWPRVRAALVAVQNQLGAGGGVVMEGRDIGTVVFPHAGVKVFLTASDEERARRRALQLQVGGREIEFEDVLREVRERDRRDAEREHSPMRPADDAHVVVTDGMTQDEVVSLLVELARKAAAAS